MKVQEKLEQIITEASAFTEFDTRTDDAFIRIRKLATEALDQIQKYKRQQQNRR